MSAKQKKNPLGCSARDCLAPAVDGVTTQNPILCHALGICSALAVTGYISTTIVMSVALMFTAAFSSLLVSLLRNMIPRRVRLISQMLIISTLVIVVHLFLRAYYFDMSKALGPYVGLIITNCIILGRCESYALRNPPLPSLLDGLGSAMGYAWVLLAISVVREALGHGTFLGMGVMPAGYTPNLVAGAAPGAFLVMGVVIWIISAIRPDLQRTEHCG